MSQTAYKDADLSKLIDQASQGEEVIVEGKDGRRFRLVEVTQEKPRPKFGSAKGQVKMLEGFDDPIEGFEKYV